MYPCATSPGVNGLSVVKPEFGVPAVHCVGTAATTLVFVNLVPWAGWLYPVYWWRLTGGKGHSAHRHNRAAETECSVRLHQSNIMRSDALHRSTGQNCSSVLKGPTVSLNMAPAEEELTVLPSVASGAYCMEPASAQSRQEQPSSCVCQPTVSAQFGLHTTASEDVTKCFRQGRPCYYQNHFGTTHTHDCPLCARS